MKIKISVPFLGHYWLLKAPNTLHVYGSCTLKIESASRHVILYSHHQDLDLCCYNIHHFRNHVFLSNILKNSVYMGCSYRISFDLIDPLRLLSINILSSKDKSLWLKLFCQIMRVYNPNRKLEKASWYMITDFKFFRVVMRYLGYLSCLNLSTWRGTVLDCYPSLHLPTFWP